MIQDPTTKDQEPKMPIRPTTTPDPRATRHHLLQQVGMSSDQVLQHTDVVDFVATGNTLEDRLQVTMSVREFWYLLEALDFV